RTGGLTVNRASPTDPQPVMMAPNAVEGRGKPPGAGCQARMSAPVSDFHRQAVRHIYQTPFQQLHASAPQAVNQSRRKRPSSSGGRNQMSATVGRGSALTRIAMPRPLMARKAFSSV